MRTRVPWAALSVVLTLVCVHPRAARSCPHPCACYVPSEVHCTFRSLVAVPAGISEHVERMNLGFNSIQAVSETSFAGLSKLELLMLHGNDIPSIPDQALRDLSSLQVFKFSYNKLRVITRQTFQGLSNLMRLHVDHNKIEFIHPQAFQGLLSLRLLHLEGNQLQQLHPGTFSTFTLLDHFRLSTLRHLYLAENMMQRLPGGILQSMPLLENLYLHGNPWACDCEMKWFLDWTLRSKGILKCKKDKAYAGGQWCTTCSSPRQLRKQEILKLPNVPCVKPSIESPLKQNRSWVQEEEEEEEQDQEEEQPWDGQLALDDSSPASRWNISLNMTDEHGNTVLLFCDIRKPTGLPSISLNQTEPPEIDVNATVALDFECPMTRENYEKLWKLIAYYSEVPVTLAQEVLLGRDSGVSHQYHQDPNANPDALYYTGVRAQIEAWPTWVLQPSIHIQLNRRSSTAKKVILSYSARYSQTISAKDTVQARSPSWVMIEPSSGIHRAQTFLEGEAGQLSCHVKASESPSISWVLPNGSVLRAPMQEQGSRFSVLSGGWLKIRTVEQSDSGLYQCIAEVPDEVDQMAFRVLVQVPTVQPPEGSMVSIEKDAGEPVMLPCSASAVPEAHLSWILPSKRIIDGSANASHAYMWADGSLSIPSVQVSHAGYYRCVAVNLHGADHVTVGLTVRRKGAGRSGKRGRRPGRPRADSRPRGDIVEDEGGSGVGGDESPSGRTLHPKDQEVFIKPEGEATLGDKVPQKGRRKLKLWGPSEEKDLESNVAEGRRVFESRRRINMANKQINPERWADILARVRGKNLPKATEVPQDIVTTMLPSESPEGMSLSPVISLLAVSPMQAAPDPEESSAQGSLFGEEERVASTISSPGMRQEHSHGGALLPKPQVTSPRLDDRVIGEDLLETTEDLSPAAVDLQWELATSPGPEAYETSTPRTSEEPIGDQTATEAWSPPADVDRIPKPRRNEEEPPLDEVSLAESQRVKSVHPDGETYSQPDVVETLEDHPLIPPTTAVRVEVSSVPQSLEEHLEEQDVPAWSSVEEKPDSTRRVENRRTTQRTPSRKRVTKKKFLGETPTSRRRESEEQDTGHTTLKAMSTASPFAQPWATTRGTLPAGGVTTQANKTPSRMTTPPPALPTQPSRRRPSGRRKLRPHKSRQRQKPSPPAVSASTDTSSPSPPSPLPATKTPKQAQSSPVPTSWVDNTAHVTKQLDPEKPTESISRGTTRRRNGKRPNRHRFSTTATVSSKMPVSKPSPLETPHEPAITSGSETRLPPLETGETDMVTRRKDYATATPETPTAYHRVHVTTPVPFQPGAGREELTDHDFTHADSGGNDTRLRSELLREGFSMPDPLVPTVGESKEASLPVALPGSPSWPLPRTALPGEPSTDTPGPGLREDPADSPLFRELEAVAATSQFAPSASLFASVPQGKTGAPTTFSSAEVELSRSLAETTTAGWEPREGTVAHVPSETCSQKPIPTPGRVEEQATAFPPTAPASLATTTLKPTPITPGTPPTWAGPKENIFLNFVGNPETKAPVENIGGSQHRWRPEELSTPSHNQNGFDLSPEQELAEERDNRRTNSLLHGPESHLPRERVHTARPLAGDPTKPTPPRGSLRPPLRATESPLRYFGTFQPPHHFTSKLEITAYPSRVFPDSKQFMIPQLPSMKPAAPTHPSKPSISSRLPDQSTNRFNGYSKVFGNNNIPEPRIPVHQPAKPRLPYDSNGRFPFFTNRTFSFPQLGVTLKPWTSTSPAPVTRERKVTPAPYNRFPSQSFLHVDLGPPAPPVLQPPRTMPPPSIYFQKVPLVHTTQSSIFPMTSASQSPGSSHHSSLKIFVGGPPAPNFWTLGEKPQIITNPPQTLSVTAETDALFPCEATGKPKPFITWTKVSTGALMTPNTRIQRFQVLKNGTLLIRRVQVQDRGQYVCTASNLHGVDRMGVLLSVSVLQPEILAPQFQDVTVYLGDTIAMECLAKGTPAPRISWIFPDRRVWQTVSPAEGRVTLHQNRTLSIKDASFADRGVYKCLASNAAGADSLAIRLHVAALPPVIQQDKAENISLPPGLSIHIHCSAKAKPPASVRWVLRDGTQVRPSQFLHGNLFVFPNGTLYIRNLAPRDSGRYECVATNLVGSARRAVRLSVQRTAAGARITSASPRRTDVRYGGTLRLHCSASGDPWPRILWRLPSKRMIDALFSFDSRARAFSNGTLVVKSVTDKDAGEYLCVARNKVGDDHAVLEVNVVMKPAKIERKEDSDHKVAYGGDLKVDCVATGLPNPEISWGLPDGSRLNSFMQSDDGGGGRAKRYVLFNNGTLYFNEVGPREEGDYTCFAQNQVGKDEMKVRVQVVARRTAVRSRTPSVVQVSYGDRVTVACEAPGEPVPRVTWLSPTSKAIPTNSEKYHIHPDGTLLIQKAQRSDSGNYTCVVRGSAGEARKTVWVHVRVEPPTINGSPDAITTVREVAPAGSRKFIHCKARGVPTPRVLWAFPEGVILPAPYYGHRVTVHSNGSLDIRSLRKSDSVQLQCIARSEGGEARMIVQLTVLEPLEKPIFHGPESEKITATAGHTISLNCSAAGSPPPTLLWVLPNGTELRAGQRLHRFYHRGDGMMHITGLAPEDAGAYRCVARNSAGHSERLVALSVGLQPTLSKQYHNLVSIINGESLQLHCSLPGAQQPGRFSWTLPNGVALDSPQALGRFSVLDNGTLTVREASVFDRGTYTCRAQAEHGSSSSSSSSVLSIPVIVIAYPPRITSEPTPVIYTRPGSTVKLSCMAMGIPKAEVSWELPDKSHLKAGAQARLYGNRFLHPQGSLTIQHATQRDAGFYKCKAQNILGTDSKTTYIHIY
ncbi:matrix-remodeling-associated protein 5 [Heterocephalus glaber]|uniref:Matrix-remodeling-associated protein 5 n=1 Tax=Heterocephalus glaber TaxID=10181 RepID=A0AAX6Q8H8_HETGA|nr:matrix-remodeling-associated protein 5 [Heterocephalus glaber]